MQILPWCKCKMNHICFVIKFFYTLHPHACLFSNFSCSYHTIIRAGLCGSCSAPTPPCHGVPRRHAPAAHARTIAAGGAAGTSASPASNATAGVRICSHTRHQCTCALPSTNAGACRGAEGKKLSCMWHRGDFNPKSFN